MFEALRSEPRLTGHDKRGKLPLSPVGFGCGPNAGLMVSTDAERRRDVVMAALESGIDFFDTAAAYGDGASELNLGAVLAEFEAETHLLTKVLVGPENLGDVKGAVCRSIAESSRRTATGRFTGVTLHNRLTVGREPNSQVGIGPTLTIDEVLGRGGVLEALEELRDEGKVGAFGFTTLGGDRSAIEAAIESERFDYVNAICGLLGPLDRDMPPIAGAGEDFDVVRAASARGLDVIGLRVFGGGLLLDPREEHREAVDAFTRWAREHETSLSRLALLFALSNPDITALVIGFTERRHVEEAVAAVRDGSLTDGEIAGLVRARRGG